jgi:predicted small metal-binding protein
MFTEWSQEFTRNGSKLEGKFWRFFPEYVLSDVEPRIKLRSANLPQESFTISGNSEAEILKKAQYKIADAERRHGQQDAQLDVIRAERLDKIRNK